MGRLWVRAKVRVELRVRVRFRAKVRVADHTIRVRVMVRAADYRIEVVAPVHLRFDTTERTKCGFSSELRPACLGRVAASGLESQGSGLGLQTWY